MVTSCFLDQHHGASRVACAEDGGGGQTVVRARSHTDGMPSAEGRYLYADDLVRAMQAGRLSILRHHAIGMASAVDMCPCLQRRVRCNHNPGWT